MNEMLSQRLYADQVRDSVRVANKEWVEGHVYKATVRRFGDGVEISIRDVEQERLKRSRAPEVPIYLQLEKSRSVEDQAIRDEENKRRSIYRAKQMVRWLCKSMQADHFLTVTYRENLQDIEQVKKHWREFVRLVRKRYPKWQYVVCLEQQDRGAWHLHVATHGRSDVHWLRRCWWMALGHRVEVYYTEDGKKHLRALVEDRGEWRQAMSREVAGNIDLQGPSKRFGGSGVKWKSEQLSAYMAKYMSKAFETIQSGRRYWPSKEIAPPLVEKRWLNALNWGDAVREVHVMVRELYSCERLQIWASEAMPRMWFSGSGVVCPF